MARIGRRLVTPAEVRTAKRLREQGQAFSRIAAQLGRVKSTVYHMVRA